MGHMYAQNRWQQGVKGFFIKNLPLMFFVLFIFIIGVAFGAFAIKTLTYAKRLELVNFLSTFFNGLAGKFENQNQIQLMDAIWLNVKIVALMWILGLSMVGMPGIPIIVFLRGFIIGFTVGLLVNELGYKGMIFALVSVLPQNLIIVPATVLAGMAAIGFSVTLIKSLVLKRPINFGTYLMSYSIIMILISCTLVIASLIEGFITPVFMRLAARLVIKK